MAFSKISASCSILLLCAILVTSVSPLANVYGTMNQIVSFRRTPSGYDNQTGSFRLGSQLTTDWETGNRQVTRVCLMFDYFIFNAQAGQLLQGQVQPGSTGNKPVYYAILTSPTQLNVFWNSNCGRGNWQFQAFTSSSTISWTAPKDGQYALVFMVSGFYSGVVYFLP